MQLILDSEASIDIKTKMSLSEDNVDKSASDILTGVQKGVTSNGDITKESTVIAEIKEKNVESNDQDEEPAPVETNNILEKSDEPVTSKNADIVPSNDCPTTELNGNVSSNEDSIEKSEPIAQCENGSDEKETINNEENCTDINSIEAEANNEGTANCENEVVSESEINSTECNKTSPEVTISESNPDDVVSENSNPCDLKNVKQAVDDTESVDDTGSTNNITPNTDLSDNVKIKQEEEETSICDSVDMDLYENSDIKKEAEDISSQNDNSELNCPSIPQDTLDNPTEEKSDSDLKLEIIKTETTDNEPESGEKETMETDDLDIDKTDENNVISSNLDNINDSVQEHENKSVSATNQEEDNFITDDVTSMDVETKISAIVNDTQDIDFIKPAITPEPDVSDNTSVLNENNGSELDQTDDVVLNLDNGTVKSTEVVNVETETTVTEAVKSNEVVNVETETTITKADDDKPDIDPDDITEETEHTEKIATDNQMSVDEIIDLDEPKDSNDAKLSDEKSKDRKNNTSEVAKEVSEPEPILKLSNTLDILSDDEEEQAPKSTNTDNKCINIEDDDDIMLIDDDTSGNESKSDPIQEDEVENKVESKPASPTESVKVSEDIENIDKIEEVDDKDAPVVADKEVVVSTSTPDISEKTEENKLEAELKKPLIPENFLKTCKKNLVDMTRDELEEFCILKIVESILDRSNLSEIKNKLKMLTQNLEEYKKKAMMLQKQNRDLQVVFKSVQEDVKKASDAPIVPLKITRSVGMQVLMTEKIDKRRRPGPSTPNTPVKNNQPRNPVAQNPRPQKPPAQPIPVPRLVPANSPVSKSPQQQVNTNKVTSPLPNGVIKSVSPVQKGEKRTHNRIQSVTVDLTDDEPPAKLVNRTGPMPPVRLVPSQNLLAAPRTPAVNSPRKVYIPISGPQGQVRPGQTIMLKTVPSTGPRQRAQAPHMVRMPQSMRMTRPQGLRHPAPLPECMKQYQPPNWKALPPAPDLKLAKVENGIVISWKIEGYQEDSYEEIASYQLYAYQETSSPPNTALWKKIGDVKALPLPMACTLTQFMAGYKYYFAVRAVDIRSRLGPFSLPGSILLLNKITAYRTMEKQPDEPEDFTNEPLPSMGEPMEVQDAVASTLATPFAQPIIAASKSKAQKQREYRQRMAASRTPAQAAAARKSKNERQRKNRLRQTANLAIPSGSLEATTTSSSRSGEESNNGQTRSQRQHAQQPTTTADQPDERVNLTNEPLFPAIPVPMEVQEAVASTSATPFAEPITTAPKTRAQIQREYRQRIAASKTPAQAAAAREARNVRDRNNRLRQTANFAIASGSLEATTTSSSLSGQRLNTVHIDTQRQFTDQQRQTLATEPAETTVQPSTSSDQIEVQAQST